MGDRLKNKTIAVINRSEIVGRPLAAMLANDGADVSTLSPKPESRNLKSETRIPESDSRNPKPDTRSTRSTSTPSTS